MSVVSKMVEATPERSLRYHLHKHFAGTQEGRPVEVVHASDLIDGWNEFCPRERALLMMQKRPLSGRFVSTAEAVTFKIGYFVEEEIVIRGLVESGVAVALWRCQNCGHRTELGPCPYTCGSCGCKVLRPSNIRFRSQSCGIVGGADLLAKLGGPDRNLQIIEVKSIGPADFAKLVAPLAVNAWRTNLYMRLLAESDSEFRDRVDLQTARIIYVSKGGYGTKDPEVESWGFRDRPFSPFKEYTIKRDDKQTNHHVRQAIKLKKWRAGGKVPGRICDTELCKRAKYCPVRSACFSTSI